MRAAGAFVIGLFACGCRERAAPTSGVSASAPAASAPAPASASAPVPASASRSAPASASASGSAPAPAGIVELHYPGWSMTAWPPSAVSFVGATDVVLFSLLPGRDGAVDAATNGLTDERVTAATARIRTFGARVLVAIGGAKTAASFRDAGEPLARAIAAFVDRHRLDGVVIDIEPLADLARDGFTVFARALRKTLGPARTIAVDAIPARAEIALLRDAAPVLDRVSLMVYIDPPRERDAADAVRALGVGPTGRIVWNVEKLCAGRPPPCAPLRVSPAAPDLSAP